MYRTLLPACLIFLRLISTALAEPAINVPNFHLLPNKAGQVITLSVTGGDMVVGLNLVAQVGSDSSGPKITAVNLTSGTIFNGNALPQQNAGNPLPSRTIFISTATQSGLVSAHGVFATLTLDTTGISSGSFAFQLTNVPALGSTDFGPDLQTGDIVTAKFSYTDQANQVSFLIVPEPNSLLSATMGVACMALVGVRIARQQYAPRRNR